jgi:hypothetical protein
MAHSRSLTLLDGREITVDISKINIKEFREVCDPSQSPDDEDAILCKVYGMTKEELQSIPYPDYRLLSKTFFELIKNPLSDPNSVSESTSVSSTAASTTPCQSNNSDGN